VYILYLDASGWVDEGVGDVLDVHCYPGPLCGDPTTADPKREAEIVPYFFLSFFFSCLLDFFLCFFLCFFVSLLIYLFIPSRVLSASLCYFLLFI
jgi:hypothetical protein